MDQILTVPHPGAGPEHGPATAESVAGEFRQLDGELWYRIANVDRLPPFFMSLICSEDHWMYLASNGALTCGRREANQAIFPYYPADKLLDQCAATGPRTIIRVEQAGQLCHWEPFRPSRHGFETRRTLYKSQLGNRILFEETNQTLGLTFRYQWAASRQFGFVRSVDLVNLETTPRKLTILDGLQNLLPPGLDQNFQLRFSNLADAYKRSELFEESGLGIFYLNSIPTDRAEPSEGLLTTVAWQSGLDRPLILLSTRQVEGFGTGATLKQEAEIRGQRHAYFVAKSLELEGRDLCTWRLIVDIGYDHSRLVQMRPKIAAGEELSRQIDGELCENDFALRQFAAAVDGWQASGDVRRSSRHLANALFNAMRGGLPLSGYRVRKSDFLQSLALRNRSLFHRWPEWWGGLPDELDYADLQVFARSTGNSDLIRLTAEFLPLTFSRRHGDPTRPWNQFRIAGRDHCGKRNLGYEGNWRDIFQNWEALGRSFPGFLPGMIVKFVNATTADGFNPYRINATGYDWERPDPADPWANIGYWGDHQIVYLLKLLEQLKSHAPEMLELMLPERHCVYADIPYRINGYQSLRANPRETIQYDFEVEEKLLDRMNASGTDGALVTDPSGELHRVSLAEKLLVTGAVKLANLIPGGGIWLNTQRPEWNDAQNALAGSGASVVTVCYLRKYFEFLGGLFAETATPSLSLSLEIAELLESLHQILEPGELVESCCRDDIRREAVVSRMQLAAERHRRAVYAGLSGTRRELPRQVVKELIERGLVVLTETLRLNRRSDGLFHSFNLLDFSSARIRVEHLEEMLEGQVAILESGLLSPGESTRLLTALRHSRLYRADQNSYLLYPDRILPRFLERNRIPMEIEVPAHANPDDRQAARVNWVRRLASMKTDPLVIRDQNGDYHFAGRLRNFADLKRELLAIPADAIGLSDSPGQTDPINAEPQAWRLTESDLQLIEDIWEQTFHHRRYTGRSSSFFAYEGLGSIYWHMVSKLAMAVAGQCVLAEQLNSPAFPLLRAQFREIHDGMWLDKSPETYGAIPIDPYSHTPAHAGAQQPGMTGQVKEDLLTRLLELGVEIKGGQIAFRPALLSQVELLKSPSKWFYYDSGGAEQELLLESHSLAFTICQTPVVYQSRPGEAGLVIEFRDGNRTRRAGRELTREESREIFGRTGLIRRVEVRFSDFWEGPGDAPENWPAPLP